MLINHQIKAKVVRLITENANEIMETTKAINMAVDHGLDLVQMSDSNPPVVKIMDYNKFVYDSNKKNKDKSKAPKPLKELRFTPNIGQNDVDFKKRHAIEFLNKNHQVKLTMVFKGREITHFEAGQLVILKLISDLSELSTADYPPKLEGDKYHVVLRPKKR